MDGGDESCMVRG